MNTTVIGAGYSALALAWYLSDKHSVTLFHTDANCASSASTGLLHPFLGKFPRMSDKGEEALESAKELLSVAEKELNRPVSVSSGIFRAAMSLAQEKYFRKMCKKYPVKWGEHSKSNYPGIWVPKGLTVFSNRYLTGLRQACEKKGVHFVEQKIEHLEELKHYDQIILACGYGISKFFDLPLDYIKGQALLCQAPKDFELKESIIGKGHISLTEARGQVFIGSTYERDFSSIYPDEKANNLIEQVAKFVPEVKQFQILGKMAGVRVSQKESYLPYIKQMDRKTWVYTGFGSRGLLYHALYAQMFSKHRI